MARPQNESHGSGSPQLGTGAAAADLESRITSLESTLESIAAEGIKARIESPELIAELVATHGLDELAARLTALESFYNTWEGTEKPDVLMRIQDLESRIEDLHTRTEETVRTVATSLTELRALIRDLSAQVAVKGERPDKV